MVHRTNNISKTQSYLLGLLKCEKNHTNMERMVEQIPEIAYHQYHNFLSESKWNSQAVIYLEKPTFSVPQKKGTMGKTPTKVKADMPTFRIDNYHKSLTDEQWDKVKVRKTTKGWKYVYVHTAKIWHWDGVESNARERTLIITRTLETNPKIKYSFSNGEVDQYTREEYAYFLCSRYWVERSFDDAKMS